VNNQKFFEQHDVEWVKPDCPGAGNLTCFNNGVNRNYSSVDEITTPIDGNGNYPLTTGQAWAPVNLTWTYVANPPASIYAQDISGAQRLQNGNTLIDDGPLGTFIEVTSDGDIVWKYINPTTNTGPLTQGDSIPHDSIHPDETMNSVFRLYRYPPSYSAFTGRDLTPGDVIEKFPTAVDNHAGNSPVIQCYPNPLMNKIHLINTKGDETYVLINTIGLRIWSGKEIEKQDFSGLIPGLYFLRVQSQNPVQLIKIIKQ